MKSILFIIISVLTLNSIRAQELVRSYYDDAETQLKEEFYVVSKTDPALQGAYASFYETGGIKSEGFFENNVSTGLWTFYYSNGKPRMAGEIRDGKNFGAWTYYFDSGKKKMAGLIIEGNREGPWVLYYKNEAKQSEGKFISNKRTGTWIHYFESGGVKAKETYNDSVSTYIEYFRSGEVAMKGVKVNEKKEGAWEYYFEDGEVQAKGNYLNGQKSGTWKHYNDMGGLEAEGQYAGGQPQGMWLYYHVDGSLAAEGKLQVGEKDGSWRMYYNDGTLKGEGSYASGTGPYKEYYKDGKLKIQGPLVNGKNDGKWQYFYESGELEGDCVFKNGQGNYVGYYNSGEVKMKGRIENDLKVGIWEFYEQDGSIAGYYKPHYEEGEATFFLAEEVEEQKTLSEKRRTTRGTYVYKQKKKGYFNPNRNEFKAWIIDYNPIAPLFNRFPLGLEYYMEERLGYELLLQYHRDPFFKSVQSVPDGELLTEGFSGSIRQKFYHKEMRIGVPYFGQELRYTYLQHRANMDGEIINGAQESKYEYALLVGLRYFKNRRENGFALDVYAGFAAGYRDYQQSYEAPDPSMDPFSSLNKNNFAYSVRLGVNLGFVLGGRR